MLRIQRFVNEESISFVLSGRIETENVAQLELLPTAESPVALHLRAMNMLYEGIKQNSTIVIVPSSALETMQLGSMVVIAATNKDFKAKRTARETALPGSNGES